MTPFETYLASNRFQEIDWVGDLSLAKGINSGVQPDSHRRNTDRGQRENRIRVKAIYIAASKVS
jgi:hypothetical protein